MLKVTVTVGYRLATSLALLPLLIAGGCGGNETGASRSSTRSTEYALHTCFVPRASERLLHFGGAMGNPIAGALLGAEGRRSGVVLAHQLYDNFCSWLPYGRSLEAKGYLVLAFDFGPEAPVPQIEAAATELRRRGAERVVLVGASIGGTASLVAAAAMRPPPAAVASLSGPAKLGRMDALAAVRRLRVPMLFMAGAQDGSFTESARMLYSVAAGRKKTLDVLRTYRHGTALLTTDAGPRARELLTAFILRHLPSESP